MKNTFDRPQNFGFVEPVIKAEDYIFGSGQVDLSQPLQPNGQWDDFLPSLETQNVMGYETANCTSFGSTNQIETYLKRKYGKEYNFSDRALGIRAGTFPPGNDPQIVYEKIRKVGVASDSLLPFGGNNVNDYYDKNKISPEVEKSEKEFLENYTFKHDWVATGQLISHSVMKTALQYSPLACAIYAFAYDGEYYVRAGKDGDWIIITGYEEGKYWKGFTSYSPVIKKFKWDFGFYWVKRIHMEKNTVKEQIGIIQSLINVLLRLVGLMKEEGLTEIPDTPPTPIPVQPTPIPSPIPTPKPSLLIPWAKAIETFENANKNWNNPGAIKGLTGKFLKFSTYQKGFDYLVEYLRRAATGRHSAYRPDMTLLQFYKIYAPATDKNNPDQYSKFVADRLGVTIATKIKDLV